MKQRSNMILHLFITLLLISFSSGQLHITCIDSGTSGRQCLSYINKTANWADANSYCVSSNGTLVVLENTDITSKISSSMGRVSINVETCWVGGYRQNNKWIWLNGNNITQTHFLGGEGDCVLLNVYQRAILNYHCDKKRHFICQFSKSSDSTRKKNNCIQDIEHYEFCVPGMSQPNEICYTYMKNGPSSWCQARNSCFERGGDLASLDHDVETWGKFLIDARAARVFVGAAYNLTRWQWLNGNNIDRVNKTLLNISSSVYHCAILILHDSFALLPIQCDNPENVAFLCKGENTTSENMSLTSVCAHMMHMSAPTYELLVSTANNEHISLYPVWSTESQISVSEALPAAFTSRTVLTESPITPSEKGNVSAESITFSNLQIVSYGSSSKSPSSDVSLTKPISNSVLTSSLTNSTEKSPTQLSKSPTKSANSTARTQGLAIPISEQAIILGASIGGGIFVIATILIIILLRRHHLFGKRPLVSSKKLSEGAHKFSMKVLSRDLEHEPTFIENPLYDVTNIKASVPEKY